MEHEKVILHDIFNAARIGDLDKIRNLCEEQEIDFNVRDEWDSTPLYYACLCGHEDLVEFMLKNGARCKANTFDGERCLYAALTQRIKKCLKEYKAITAECMRREYFNEFLRSSFQHPSFCDVTFDVHGELIHAHKIILTARCPYMAEMFQTKWTDRKLIHIRHHLVDVTAFRYFIQFLYTGRVDMILDHMSNFITICKQCKMTDLINDVQSVIRNFHLYADSKPGYMKDRVSMLTVGEGVETSELHCCFSRIAEACIPSSLVYKDFSSSLPDIFGIELDSFEQDRYLVDGRGVPLFADICFIVEGYKFYCHQVFVCGRSDYFKALRNFSKTQDDGNDQLFEVTLTEISAEAFVTVVYYIYTDKCQVICQSEFAELVKEDASAIQGREETDSIPIIDDIRYHILKYALPGMDNCNGEEFSEAKLSLINELLMSLGLDA